MGFFSLTTALPILIAESFYFLLMYVDVFLANAIVAAGKAGRLAGSKVIAVILTTGLALVPLAIAGDCLVFVQERWERYRAIAQ